MNVKIISWNVRGLNEQDKRLRVKNLIRNGGQMWFVFKKPKWG